MVGLRLERKANLPRAIYKDDCSSESRSESINTFKSVEENVDLNKTGKENVCRELKIKA